MSNIFKYNSLDEYNAGARPSDESSVSFDSAEPHYDGVNIVLPFIPSNCEEGDMVVYDKYEGKKKILKTDTYNSSTFDTTRYVMSRSLYCFQENGKAITVAIENAVSSSQRWAEDCYFRVTGFDLTTAGSITFKTYYSWAAHTDNTVSWEADASLSDIVTSVNALGLSSSYFYCAVLSDETGIGIRVRYPTTATVSNIFSITDQTGSVEVEYMNTLDDSDVVFQYVTTSSIISGMASSGNLPRRNGLLTSWGGGNYDKFYAYYSVNGSSSFVAETSAGVMKKTVFDALASSTTETELALYNKYDGDYGAYINGCMVNLESLRGILGISRSVDNVEQTALLAAVMTKDYDNNEIPAFPQAYYANLYGVTTSGYTTGFEPGNFGSPTVYQQGRIMRLVGLNSSYKTHFNLCIDKYNTSGNFYGNGYYWWSVSEQSAAYAFIFYGYGGLLDTYGSKSYTFSVRGVAALSFEQ